MIVVRALVTVTAAALFLFLAGPPMLVNPPVAYTGAHIEDRALIGPTVVRIDRASPAARAGLRSGDIVACLSLRDKSVLLPARGTESPFVAGASIPVCALRHGAWKPLRVLPAQRSPGGLLYGALWIAIVRIAVFAVFLFVGIMLVMARPSPLTWVFFAYCLASVPSLAASINDTVYSPTLYAIVVSVLAVAGQAGTALMLLFALLAPDDRIPVGWRGIASWVAFTVVAGLIAHTLFEYARVDLNYSPLFQSYITYTLTALIVLVVIVRLASARGEERARYAWVALAIILGVAINDVRNAFSSGPLSNLGTLAGVLTIVTPALLMYAVLKRHVIDVRFVVSRTVVYAAITTVVVGIIGVVDWATSVYLSQARAAMVIDALVTIALGFALHRTYRWLEGAVDILLFRQKHEAEAYLHRLGRTLLRAGREETIDRALVHDPYDKFALTMAAFFRAEGSSFVLSSAAGWNHPGAVVFDADHDLVRFLVTERKVINVTDLRAHVFDQLRDGDAGPAIVIPVLQGDQLFAFALYGIHRDGTKLDPDEVQTLETLCEVGAQAYTRVENIRYRELVQGNMLPSHS